MQEQSLPRRRLRQGEVVRLGEVLRLGEVVRLGEASLHLSEANRGKKMVLGLRRRTNLRLNEA